MAEKNAAERRKKDEEAWHAWKKETDRTGNEANKFWGPLYKRMKPAQDALVRQFGGKTDMPEAAIRAHSFRGLEKGIKTWDPNHSSGAALFTHVYKNVQDGTRRYVQQGQNAGHRTPEHRAYSARADFEAAIHDFEAEFGYEPSDEDLKEHLWKNKDRYPSVTKKMTKKNALDHVQRFRMDVNLSAPGVGAAIGENVIVRQSKDERAVAELKYQISSERDGDVKKSVLELFLAGKSGSQIAKKLGIGESYVSNIRRELVRRLDALQSLR